MTNKKIKLKSGFTLVELLVVISIMGILTVITASNFVEAQKKSRDTKRKADLASISNALNMYYNDFGKFPGELNEVQIKGGLGMNKLVQNGGEFTTTDGNIYMKEVPNEKSTGVTKYTYFVGGTGKSFRLWANLENDKDKCFQKGTSNPENYSVNIGCMYSVYSSNVGATTPLL
jgi:type II secretion system protein G